MGVCHGEFTGEGLRKKRSFSCESAMMGEFELEEKGCIGAKD